MFDRAFMKSRKVQSLARDHRLVYASILPFLDREGRIIAEPIYLKAMVFRHSDFTTEELGEAVRALADVGLVELYADEDNSAIVQYTKFHEFNTPNAKEARSDLPAPRGEGAVPCREPLITHARAMHVQCTGNASGERNVNGTLTVNENVNVNVNAREPDIEPPPDLAEAAEDISELERAEASRLARRHDHRVLQSTYPDVWRSLGELTSAFGWREPQFRKIAEKLLTLTREHGPHKVIAVADKVLLNASNVRNPIAFLEKVLSEDARASTAGVASPLASDDALERLFGVN
jgi:hypothetical protein